MLKTCKPRTFQGARDRALMLFLLDSGVRHQELHDPNLGDVNMDTGAVLVRSGKGRKPRFTFIGTKTRRALLAYHRVSPPREDDAPPWLSQRHTRLSMTREQVARGRCWLGINTTS
jgi:site-specific recombinase XerC